MGDGGAFRYGSIIDVMEVAAQSLRSQVYSPAVASLDKLEISTQLQLKKASGDEASRLTDQLAQIADVRRRLTTRLTSLESKVKKKIS